MKVVVRIRWDRIWPDAEGRDRFPVRKTMEWQRKRWMLFLQSTYPSLLAQTHQAWEIWLLADPELKPLHAELSRSAQVTWKYEDRPVLPADCAVMRIDSDDAMGREALALMLERLGEKKFVQLDRGFALASDGTIYEWRNPSPPFLMMKGMGGESLPDFGNHGKAREDAVVIPEEPYLVLLHDTNICNKVGSSWVKGEIFEPQRQAILHRCGVL